MLDGTVYSSTDFLRGVFFNIEDAKWNTCSYLKQVFASDDRYKNLYTTEGWDLLKNDGDIMDMGKYSNQLLSEWNKRLHTLSIYQVLMKNYANNQQNRTITKLDKQFVTRAYFDQHAATVFTALARNAIILRGGMNDKLVKSLTGNWVNETEIRKMKDDLVLDVINCQITQRRLVDPNNILDILKERHKEKLTS